MNGPKHNIGIFLKIKNIFNYDINLHRENQHCQKHSCINLQIILNFNFGVKESLLFDSLKLSPIILLFGFTKIK